MKPWFTPLFLFALAPPAGAQEPVRIGVAAPVTGPNAVLGAQVLAGARQAAAAKGVVLVEADAQCTPEAGKATAERFVAEKVKVTVGFLCAESLEGALPVLRSAAIPAIDVGVRADRFTAQRRKTGDPVWRLAPHAGAEAEALAATVATRWRDVAFGILDDGSVYGRNLADAVREKVEAGGQRPAAVDGYRPAEEKQFGLARRLARTGVTHLVIAGDRGDAATIARDAAANGLALQFLGGEQLLDEPPDAAEIPEGTLAVGVEQTFRPLSPPGEADAVERSGYFGPGLAAVEIAATATDIAKREGKPLPDVLNATTFDTSLGRIRFDAKGDSDLNLFRVFRFNGRDFVPEAGG
ncbi:ABC transporter substrate-binding protein [Aureimonas leprariae]|uniref:ABC transporter substrate-binding protein n=1 Tax=Plantimonas leprariae TaxID=2615207 RepID=A0A7V7TX46_9HYPH|nr:ABC transporter substrate-binding protein [Aureimonas leprariae]KAB0680896.1 ABC transporter substrate-binding protein [Aureimonas leprariae]